MPSPARPRSTRPFLASPRTAFYFPSRMIDAARVNLERAIRRSEGIGMVVGGPGTGKSLLLAVIAEQVRDDFEVALLTGARICTRRALWQSILAELGEPYRGIDEADLRIGVLERIRGLSATGSGLVILVDEAHTLPIRLLEELRLLSNVPTPLPAVHVVLAGTTDLEERLASPRMEPLAQRIAVRGYLEPLDHAETVAYLRSQCAAASMNWDATFETGCDDAVFTITDGVPRLINQVCDHALVRAQEQGRSGIATRDIEEAWRQIQQLPSPSPAAFAATTPGSDEPGATEVERVEPFASFPSTGFDGDGGAAIEFGSLDDELLLRHDVAEGGSGGDGRGPVPATFAAAAFVEERRGDDARGPSSDSAAFETDAADPWSGPEVELVFDPADDPFEAYFDSHEPVAERFLVRGPDDFRDRLHVASREGADLVGRIEAWERAEAVSLAAGRSSRAMDRGAEPLRAATGATAAHPTASIESAPGADSSIAIDDSDMVVIEDDEHVAADDAKRSIFAVRPGDYRTLFARLRRGDGGEAGR